MSYEDAIDATVSFDEAFHELKAHGIYADYEGRELFDCHTGETIAWANESGEYEGGDILAYLGY